MTRAAARGYRSHPFLTPFFSFLLVVMTLHEVEHLVQVGQKDVVDASCPNDCRGLLGFIFDVEWVHFAYNTSILAALLGVYAGGRMWRGEWRARRLAWGALTGGIAVQIYHVVEHTEKITQWLDNGHHSPTPGFLGKLLGPAEGRNFSLIELHFTLNTVVFVLVAAGYLGFGFHRRLWESRTPLRLALAAGTAVVTAFGGGVAWSARPPTVHLAGGIHRGPLVLDEASRLEGEAGAVVRGGIVVTANDVVVRDIAVVGGDHGITVDGAQNVLLERVSVSGAKLDAIHVRRGSVTIRGCRIDALGSRWTQGVDVSFSIDLPPSIVKRCTIVGGLEGLVSHSAHVQFSGNHITRTTLRGITVTEMSMGHVARNRVERTLGVGIFCGDYSHCMIEHNTVSDTRADHESQDGFRRGYGILAHFGASAQVEDNQVHRSPGGVAAVADGVLRRR